jgi:hypothetical protein
MMTEDDDMMMIENDDYEDDRDDDVMICLQAGRASWSSLLCFGKRTIYAPLTVDSCYLRLSL